MSQSLAKLQYSHLPINNTSKSRKISPSHKYEFTKNYVISTKAANHRLKTMERNTKGKDNANRSVEIKPKQRNLSFDPIKINHDERFSKLDALNTKSLLARSGLLSLQQRLLQIELSKAMKNLDNSFAEELSSFTQGNTFEKPLDNLYEKYLSYGNSIGIRLS
ncbi:unnamed protein product [Blepharisma stoltei]|uniref:Uncharacterized protein n=1 Tax=Blepharisma stoltei TaxID=1481888 RepID=A0AAU9ITD3_9CILI|nr:unnamed protein product [Blepharisma stoltei]